MSEQWLSDEEWAAATRETIDPGGNSVDGFWDGDRFIRSISPREFFSGRPSWEPS